MFRYSITNELGHLAFLKLCTYLMFVFVFQSVEQELHFDKVSGSKQGQRLQSHPRQQPREEVQFPETGKKFNVVV